MFSYLSLSLSVFYSVSQNIRRGYIYIHFHDKQKVPNILLYAHNAKGSSKEYFIFPVSN